MVQMVEIELENRTQKKNAYTNEAFRQEENISNGNSNSTFDKNFGVELEKQSNNLDSKKRDSVFVLSSLDKVEKEEWSGGMEFLMACISTSVGLGNVWRFPFTAFENGGGAFLIPYIIILLLVGKPFYYLEAVLGQFTSRSCTKTWMMSPAMKGLGYGQVLVSFCIVSYYCSLMALTVYYLAASFQSVLPWSYCQNEWKGFCLDTSSNITITGNGNLSSSAELYFRKIVLNELNSIDEGLGLPSWSLVLCLLFCWLCLFGIMSQGVKSSGKAVYFLATFPYVVMLILLVRTATLEGAINGVIFFVSPKWEELLKPKVWYAALTQCFFSLGVCLSPIITYSSHNNFHHPVSRDVMIVTTLDTFTSLIAGCTIFGILGNLAHEMEISDISKVVQGGSGLAFISYPDALSRFSVVPQVFSALFFVMMFTLGIGSAVAFYTSVCDIVVDKYVNVKKWKLILGMCTIGFFSGIIYTTPGGQWFVTLIDYYGGTCIAIIIGVAEIVTIFWIYGLYNFLNDMEFMLGFRPGFYWRICWAVITPILMIVILVYTFLTYEPPTYDGLTFPGYAYGIGWSIFTIGVLQMLYFIIREIWKHKNLSTFEAFRAAFQPSESWGPFNINNCTEWKEFVAKRKFRRKGGLVELFFK